MKIRKLMSGMLAGVMTVSSSVVYQIPAAAEENSSAAVATISETLQPESDSIFMLVPKLGRYTDSSSISISAAATSALTQKKDGETVEAEDALIVVINGDWDNQIKCDYVSGQLEYSMTLNSAQLNGAYSIQIISPNNEQIEVTVEAYGYAQDNREVSTIETFNSNFTMTVDKPEWIGGDTRADLTIENAGLTETWSGKTIKELREAVSRFDFPVQPYINDSVGAGVEAFTQSLFIETETGWYSGNGDVYYALNHSDSTYMDQIFLDDSNDSEVIKRIGVQISTISSWNDSTQKNYCPSEKLNALQKGDQIILEFVADDREPLALPEAIGTLTMDVFNGDWIIGCTASGDIELPAPDGVTYGETTVSELLEEYKLFNVPAVSIDSCELDTLTPDMLNMGIAIRVTKDGEVYDLYQDGLSVGKNGIIMIDGFTDAQSHSDWTIKAICLSASVITDWDSEQNKSYSVCPELKSMTRESAFDIDLTENTRGTLTLPEKKNTVSIHAYIDEEYNEGALASDEIELGKIDGITYGDTTVDELLAAYRSITIPELSFHSSNIEGLTRDMMENYVTIYAKKGDETVKFRSRWALDFDGGSATIGGLRTDNGEKLANFGEYVIDRIVLDMAVKTTRNDSGKNVSVCENVRGLSNGDEIVIELTEDVRDIVTVSPLKGTQSIWTFTDDSWLDGTTAGSDLSIDSVSGITPGTTKVSELLSGFKSISVPSNEFTSSSLDGLTRDMLSVSPKLHLSNGEESVWLYQDEKSLDGGSFAVEDFTDGNGGTTADYSNYTIEDVFVRVSLVNEYDSSIDKSRCVYEPVRTMESDQEIKIEFTKDERLPVKLGNVLETLGKNSASLNIIKDDTFKYIAFDSAQYTDCGLIGKTMDEVFSEYSTISADAPGYVSDSVNAGADAFSWYIGIQVRLKDGDTNDPDYYKWLDSPNIPLNENSEFNISDFKDRFKTGESSKYEVYGVSANICLAYNDLGDNKFEPCSDTILAMQPEDRIHVQLAKESRKNAVIDGLSEQQTITLTAKDDANYGITAEGGFAVALGEKYAGMRLADFADEYGNLTISGVKFVSDDKSLGDDGYQMAAFLNVRNAEDSSVESLYCGFVKFGEDMTIYLDDNLQAVRDAADYVLEDIWVHVRAKIDTTGDKPIAASETIRSMSAGDTLDVVAEPGRKYLSISEPTAIRTELSIYDNGGGGKFAFNSVDADAPDGITYGTTTVGELLENYKVLSMSGLPYYSDSLNAGAAMFMYGANVYAEKDGKELFLGNGDFYTLTSDSYISLDSFEDGNSGLSIADAKDYVITRIAYNIQMVSEYDLDSLDIGDKVTLEFTQDEHGSVTLPGLSGEMTLTTFSDEQLIGSSASGYYPLEDVSDIQFNNITAGGLLESKKNFTIPALTLNTAYLDGLTQDMLEVSVALQLGDGRNVFTVAASDTAPFGKAAELSFSDILKEYSDYSVYGIGYQISVKTEEDKASGKLISVCPALRTVSDSINIILEFSEDERNIAEVPAIRGDIELGVLNSDTNEELSQWCVGAWAFSDFNISLDGIEPGKSTISQLREKYKMLDIAGPAYVSDSEDIGKDNFRNCVIIRTSDGLESNGTDMAYGERMLISVDDLIRNQSGDATIEKIFIRVSSKMEDIGDGSSKMQAASEKLRSMNDGSSITISNADSRKVYEISTDAKAFELTAESNGSYINVHGDMTIEDDEIIGMTLAELFDKYKAAQLTDALGYFSDSVGAGKDAFIARINIMARDPEAGDNDWSAENCTWLNWEGFALDKAGYDSFSKYEENLLPERADYKVMQVQIQIDAATDESGKPLSDKISILNSGDKVLLEFKEDTRSEISLPAITEDVTLYAFHDESGTWLDGEAITGNADLDMDEIIPGIKTVGELMDGFKQFVSPANVYAGDSEDIGAEHFLYCVNIMTEDGSTYGGNLTASFCSSGVFKLDNMTTSDGRKLTDADGNLRITSINYTISNRYGWNSEKNLSYSLSDKIYSMKDGDTVVLHPGKRTAVQFSVTTAKGSADISWEAVSGAEKYTVYCYSGDDIVNSSEVDSSANTIRISDLVGGETYGFAVSAYVDGKWTEISNSDIVYKTIDPTLELRAQTGITGIDLAWTRTSGATKYRIRRRSAGSWETIATVNAVKYTDTTAVIETDYDYIVIPFINGSFVTKYQSEAVGAMIENSAPVVKTAVSGTNVSLSWTETSGATKYRVRRKSGGAWTTLATVSGTSYTDAAPADGENTYVVIPYIGTEFNTALQSEPVTVKVARAAAPVITSSVNGRTVELTWTETAGASKYRLRVNDGTGWQTVATTAELSFSYTSDDDGLTLEFVVIPYINGAFNTALQSKSAKATIEAESTTAVLTVTAQENNVTVSWNKVSGASKYRIRRNDGTGWTTLQTSDKTSYVDTTAQNGGRYTYVVYPFVNGSFAEPSKTVKVALVGGSGSAALTVFTDDGVAELSWAAVPGVKKYRVRRNDGTGWKTMASTSNLSWTDNSLVSGTAYTYVVYISTDGVNYSDPSSTLTVKG